MEKQISYIKDALKQKSPTVVGCITSLGEISEGTSKSGEAYRTRKGVLTDNSISVPLVLWGHDCDVVKTYDHIKIESGYVTEYQEKKHLSVGKFGTLMIVTKEDLLPSAPGTFDTAYPEEPTTSNGPVSVMSFSGSGKTDEERNTEARNHAKKEVSEFDEFMKELGYESPEGHSAVWNSSIIHYWRK